MPDRLTYLPNASFDYERDILDTQEENRIFERIGPTSREAALVSLLREIPAPSTNFLNPTST